MSYPDHLSDKQFYKYKPAREEGKEASDWLSTEEGHDWQSRYFDRGGTAPSLQNSRILRHSEYYHPLFSIRGDDENFEHAASPSIHNLEDL